eukprot:g34529.t1
MSAMLTVAAFATSIKASFSFDSRICRLSGGFLTSSQSELANKNRHPSDESKNQLRQIAQGGGAAAQTTESEWLKKALDEGFPYEVRVQAVRCIAGTEVLKSWFVAPKKSEPLRAVVVGRSKAGAYTLPYDSPVDQSLRWKPLGNVSQSRLHLSLFPPLVFTTFSDLIAVMSFPFIL